MIEWFRVHAAAYPLQFLALSGLAGIVLWEILKSPFRKKAK